MENFTIFIISFNIMNSFVNMIFTRGYRWCLPWYHKLGLKAQEGLIYLPCLAKFGLATSQASILIPYFLMIPVWS